MTGSDVFEQADRLLERSIEHQRRKVLAVARRLNPRLTADDVMQPHDFPELRDNGEFQYEDGILAGLLSAQVALRALGKDLHASGSAD